jgi:hypothetical protein
MARLPRSDDGPVAPKRTQGASGPARQALLEAFAGVNQAIQKNQHKNTMIVFFVYKLDER